MHQSSIICVFYFFRQMKVLGENLFLISLFFLQNITI